MFKLHSKSVGLELSGDQVRKDIFRRLPGVILIAIGNESLMDA